VRSHLLVRPTPPKPRGWFMVRLSGGECDRRPWRGGKPGRCGADNQPVGRLIEIQLVLPSTSVLKRANRVSRTSPSNTNLARKRAAFQVEVHRPGQTDRSKYVREDVSLRAETSPTGRMSRRFGTQGAGWRRSRTDYTNRTLAHGSDPGPRRRVGNMPAHRGAADVERISL
jgi:hypothetical protein